jgi:hypothetical protein
VESRSGLWHDESPVPRPPAKVDDPPVEIVRGVQLAGAPSSRYRGASAGGPQHVAETALPCSG